MKINPQVLAAAVAVLRTANPEITAAALEQALDAPPPVAASPSAPRRMFTLGEFAKLIGVSLPTVFRMMKSGELQTVKIGQRNTRITAAEVDRYVNGTLHTAKTEGC